MSAPGPPTGQAQRVPDPAASGRQRLGPELSSIETMPDLPMGEPKKILVVDDRQSWLQTIKHILCDDYDLSLCSDVAQAKRAFNEADYDLLILDKNLAGESGLDLLRDFRRSKAGMRAIILTEYEDVASAVESMKLGALDYVPKKTENLSDVLRAKVQEALTTGVPFAETESAVEALIRGGESSVLEFKSSLRWDVRAGKPNKELEKVIVKTIAGFMNSEGAGNLIIGVNDDGTIVGLQHDYATLGKRQNRDGFENLLTTVVFDACGKDCAPLINVIFHRLGESDICQVEIKPSPKPVFVRDEKGEHLFVRTGNSTRLLTTREAIEYCKLRWKIFS